MTTGKALNGKPYAGNPHVRFDEGEVASAATSRRGSLLYKKHAINHLAVSVALSLVCNGALASDLYWTGATDNIWSKAANWYNENTGNIANTFPGAPNRYDHTAYFDQTLADGKSAILQRTVVFNLAEEMRGSVYVYDGTLADPIVFSAIENYGLSVTNSAKTFQIGKDGQAGWLKMQGGSFSSNPGLKINNGGWIMDGDASFSTTNNIQIGSAENCSATAVFNSGSITQTKVGGGSYFYVGCSQGSVGTVTNVGATITIANSFRMGSAESASAYYYQSGGSLNIDNRLVIGYRLNSENSVFEIAGGTVTMGGTSIRFAYSGSLLLKGGIVSPKSIMVESSSNDKNVFLFDGGTLKAQEKTDTMFPASDKLALKVGANGGVFDTAGYASITLADDFESAVDNGTDGGMRFTGGGSAKITGAIGYTGPTTVELGTVVTIADRANIFGEGKGGLRCSLPNPKPEGNEYITVLTTTGEDDFTASDLTKCAAAEGTGGISFRISGDGKSIMAKRSNGLIISFH